MEIVAADIGGTHARFAIAEVGPGGVRTLGEAVTLRVAEHPDLESAWAALGARLGRPLPRAAAIAIAAPITEVPIKLTNSDWLIRPDRIAQALGLDTHLLINDFVAAAHAVAHAGPADLLPICGPAGPLPTTGVTTVCGPGTGLGVAQLLRGPGGYQVLATEGGHMDFAPLDPVEDALLARLRAAHGRVSVERIVAGAGIVAIRETLGATDRTHDATAIWSAALDGSDDLAVAALDRFCRSLGSTAGDLALAHGANAVVVGGGIGLRLRDRLAGSGFAERFVAKGRFRARMAAIPVRLIVHPQPGLLGAAAAFAQEYFRSS